MRRPSIERYRTHAGLFVVAWMLLQPLHALASPDLWVREGWTRTDFTKRAVAWSELTTGGLSKDGIPSIDDPRFVSAGDATDIPTNEPVIGLELNGDARAYPLRILIWHEIVNDVVGGIPVAVTYCPLCNASIVFDRRVDGRTMSFGTTGKLRRSDLVMYDRQTESWWQQFTGNAIVGAMTAKRLGMIPSRLESLALFKERFPNGRVLTPVDPARRAYGRNPYEGYDTTTIPFLYRGEFPQGINPLARVVVIRRDEMATAVTLELLTQVRKLEVGEHLVTWRGGQASALDHVAISAGRDVGNVVVRKLRDGHLEDVPYDVTFAFVFHAFHPESQIVQNCRIRDGSSSEGHDLSNLSHVHCAETPAK